MRLFLCTCVFFLTAFVARISLGQQPSPNSACSLPTPPFQINKPNIFTPEQEQWLGDAQATEQESEYNLLPEKDSAELTRIGQKLLAQLPPTPIHYQFRVYEADDANGFSIAGGYVYISRKLITDARSEDEVAGVLAHEIGHIYTHQVAILFSRQFRYRMSLTSLGGLEDVSDKIQQLMNVPESDREQLSEDDLEKDELLADKVGLYALVRAGYAAKAFSQNLDRITANKGHTGNILTDALGATSEINMRVRAARKIADSVPEECRRLEPGSSAEFKAFQEAVRNAPIHPLIPPTPGLNSFKMDPPMRPALDHVRFSPDGNYVLAQDETSIHVLSRSPLRLLFSIDAPGAQFANFTPDSTHVSFHYQTMRTELWDIASARRESYHELIDYEGCPQTGLSPDGKTFVCLALTTGGVWLKLTDVDSGKRFYDNKNFYLPDLSSQAIDVIERYITEPGVGTVAYSQDGRIMIIATGTRAMAYDLDRRQQITMGGDLSHLLQGRIAFAGPDRLVFECDWDSKDLTSRTTYKMCDTTFPGGLAVNSFKLGAQWMESITRGDHVLIGPLRENAAILVDPATGKASAAFKLDSLDVFDKLLASETERGGVTVGELGGQHMDAVDLPVSPLPRVAAADFSLDGRFLAFSGSTRSAIWDLNAEKQVALMRPFQGVRFDEQDQMYAEYQESHQKPGQNFHIDLKTGKATEGAKFDREVIQYGDVLVKIQPMDKFDNMLVNTEMQVFDPLTGAQLWSRRFPHETPIVRKTDGGALLLIGDLTQQTATDESSRAGKKLVKASDKKGEWVPQGLLIVVVSSRTGEIQHALVTPELHYANSRDRRSAELYGDYLVVHGNFNNSVIYRLSDGVRTGAFYGRAIAGDGKLGLIAATNRDQEVILYDAATGKELKRVTVDHLPRAARFIPAKNALLVLTANQSVYTIDLPAAGHAETAPAH
jgi:hypothetical protein